MANSTTQDVTIWNEGGGFSAAVTSNNELSVAGRIWDGTNYVTVTGNRLDVNVPTHSVTQGTSPWVTSNNNGAGAAAVNIQDGGNSITVDGTIAFSNTTIAVTQSTSPWVCATRLWDGTNYVTVTGNKLDVNATMTWSNANKVNIWDGTDNLNVNADGSLNDNILSVIPGTGATNLGKAEDAGHTTGDVGVMALAVRNDAGTALAGTTLDYIPLGTDALGNLRVNISGTSVANKNIWQQKVEEGKAFVLTTDLITVSGTAQVPFLLLRNPVASGKTIRIWKISYNLIASITSDSGTYKIFRDCSITTNGTAKTPNKWVKSQAATPVLLAGTAPTVSANGTLLFVSATTSGGSFNVDLYDTTWYIEQGENMYFTIQPAVTGKAHGINIWFYEE